MLLSIRLVATRLPDALVATIHDELLLEVPATEADKAARLLAEAMAKAFATLFPEAPIAGLVKTGIGVNWLDAKP